MTPQVGCLVFASGVGLVLNIWMANFICPLCGGKMKGHGKTASGARRWQCMSCKATSTHSVDSSAKKLGKFVSWLLSKRTQAQMDMPARTFREQTSRFWEIWPVAPVCDEAHHVVHVDGIWLGRQAVILIACTKDHVIGWHLARSENSAAWAALMARIAPPDVVVADGGDGFEKARRAIWPGARVQRCTFHAFEQVKRQTTARPKLQAGAELYAIAKDLLHVDGLNDAAAWLASFSNWCTAWDGFLKERAVIDGRAQFKHERLRKARRGLEKLARAGTLFTYLDEELNRQGAIPATNNRIEGGVNRQLRVVLNEHRGLRLDRRVKAVFWWCYMHTERPMSPADILREMPTDSSIAELYQAVSGASRKDQAIVRWGTAVQWSDLHSSGPYRIDYD